MRKILLIVFLALSSIICNQKKSFSKIHNSKNYVSVPSITRIENYDKKKIEIMGQFQMDFENIYLEKDGQKIWLYFNYNQHLQTENNEILDGEMLKTFDHKMVKIKGKFKIGTTGHLGSYKAELNDIVFFEN